MKKKYPLFILLSVFVSIFSISLIYYGLEVLPHRVDLVTDSFIKFRLNINACHFLIAFSFIVVLATHLWLYKNLRTKEHRSHIFWSPVSIYFLCWLYVQLVFFIDWLNIRVAYITPVLVVCEPYLLLFIALFTTLQIACYWFLPKKTMPEESPVETSRVL